MKRFLIIILSLTANTVVALAQTTIIGKVVDEHGNALSGVEVGVNGSDIKKTTYLNGMFSFTTETKPQKLTFQSTGRKSQTCRYHDGMIVRMKPLTWWNEQPQRWHFFVGPEIIIGNTKPVGIRVAAAKQFGIYAHFAMTAVPNNMGEQSEWEYVALGSHYKKSATVFGGGAMVRLGCPIYFYAGVVSRSERLFVEHLDHRPDGERDGWVEATGYFLEANFHGFIDDGICPEAGLMFNVNQFYLNAGVAPKENLNVVIGGGLRF